MTPLAPALLLAVLMPAPGGVGAAAPAGSTFRPKEAALWEKLEARIAAVDRGLDGVLGVFVKDLETGRTLELRAAEPFPAASTIKLAVLYELYRQADEGRLDLTELTRPGLPRVGGGGVLVELGGDVRLTWRDLAVLMMGWSDNEAANLLIDKVGREAVDRRLDTLGFAHTRLRRKMMDLEAARRGEENVATPAELAGLMEVVQRGTGLTPASARDILEVTRVPKWGTRGTPPSPFRDGLPETVPVADKSGELEGVRCAVAGVALRGRPYVAAIMTAELRREADGEEAIRTISAALYETFDRLARASEYGRLLGER